MYLSFGMTTSEFWDQDPWLAWAYREADKIKTERTNTDEWWQGMYIRQAVHSALSVSLPWFKRNANYPERPYRVTPLSEEEKEEAKQKEIEKAVRSLTAWKDSWDKQHGQ